MPRPLPSLSCAAVPSDGLPPFPTWKAAAVMALARINEQAVAAMERAWRGYYIRGLSAENAALQAACDYAGCHPPDWAIKARW